MTTVTMKVTMPPELVEAWLQNLRDFDTAHDGACHFEVVAHMPTMPMAKMVEVLQAIDPPFNSVRVFRKQ